MFEDFVRRRALRDWQQATDRVPTMTPARLRALQAQGRRHRDRIGRLLHAIDDRLAQLASPAHAIRHPAGSDWVWRPEIWAGPVAPSGRTGLTSPAALFDGATLFHDSTTAEIATRQIRNPAPDAPAPYGMQLEVYHFTGSFLSLVLDLPPATVAGLTGQHIIRLEMQLTAEQPREIFARLNVKHGPNVEQLVQEINPDRGDLVAEFDLFYATINEKRLERAWLDLIFERPAMNRITLHDLTLGRRLRAEL